MGQGAAQLSPRGWYTPVDPPAALAEVLACSWTAVPTGRHRLVPDGCIDLLWISTGDMWLCGPETTAWRFELPPGTTAVGVRFRPGVAPTLFDLDAASIRDRRVRLRGVVDAGRERALVVAIDAAPTPAGRMRALESFVHSLAATGRHDPVAAAILATVLDSPRAAQARVAAAVGLTTRQLHRHACRAFGYGTSVLARLIRFQRFLACADVGSARPSLARLAIDAGYSDQAHLARDCKAITGITPTAFLAEHFPTFPDPSDPYKTGTPLAATMSA